MRLSHSRNEMLVVDGLRLLNFGATVLAESMYAVAALSFDSQNSRSLASERNLGRGLALTAWRAHANAPVCDVGRELKSPESMCRFA